MAVGRPIVPTCWKQANIAHGHQQVNNGTAVAHAGEIEKGQWLAR
jgi:hypothetical protein